jgi:hypothetical protein
MRAVDVLQAYLLEPAPARGGVHRRLAGGVGFH